MRERSPGVWELRVPLARDPVTGKVRQRSRTFHGGKREAQRAMAALIAATAGERTPTEGTFGHLLEQWVRSAELATRTREEYRRVIDQTLIPALGDIPLRDLKGRHFDELYTVLQHGGRVGQLERVRCLAPASIRQVHAIARRALNEAIRWEWLTTNPTKTARPPTVRPSEVELPTVAEVHAVIAAIAEIDPDLALICQVALAVGARRGELCALRWRNIDWDARTMAIRRSIAETRPGLEEKDTKTHRRRTVIVDVDTLEALAVHHRASQLRAEADAPGGVLAIDAFVFSREADGSLPLKPGWVTDAFRRAAKRVTVDAHLHVLRHLNATLQLAARVPVHTVTARLGWQSPSMLMNVYGHAMPGDDAEAAEILGKLISPQVAIGPVDNL